MLSTELTKLHCF